MPTAVFEQFIRACLRIFMAEEPRRSLPVKTAVHEDGRDHLRSHRKGWCSRTGGDQEVLSSTGCRGAGRDGRMGLGHGDLS
jgi:hypothetical protein